MKLEGTIFESKFQNNYSLNENLVFAKHYLNFKDKNYKKRQKLKKIKMCIKLMSIKQPKIEKHFNTKKFSSFVGYMTRSTFADFDFFLPVF